MYKLLGIVLVVAGFLGLSFDRVKEEKEGITALKEIKALAVYLCREIEYSHIPIPDICNEYLKRTDGLLGGFLEEVCSEAEEKIGESFESIWQKKAEEYKGFKEEKKQLIKLKKCFGFSNLKMQILALTQYIDDIENTILHREKKFQDNKKLILYFGVMSGLLLSIILL